MLKTATFSGAWARINKCYSYRGYESLKPQMYSHACNTLLNLMEAWNPIKPWIILFLSYVLTCIWYVSVWLGHSCGFFTSSLKGSGLKLEYSRVILLIWTCEDTHLWRNPEYIIDHFLGAALLLQKHVEQLNVFVVLRNRTTSNHANVYMIIYCLSTF